MVELKFENVGLFMEGGKSEKPKKTLGATGENQLRNGGLCTSQLKPPPLGSRGRVGDLTVTPVKRHQYPYSLRLEFRSNAPTPEARKMKISKLSKKRHVFKRRKFPSLHVQVCSSD